jgi:predicted nucleotidyltransferase
MNIEAAVQVLTDAGVEFIIIGGWSAILHGSTYLTNDLDLFIARGAENIRRLVEALRPFHPWPRDVPENLPFVWDVATVANSTILTLRTDLGAIDLLAEVKGLGAFDEVEKEAVLVDIFGRRVRTLDLNSLIQSKRALGRDKDVNVLRELESLREAGQAAE